MTHINHQVYPKSIAYNETAALVSDFQSFDQFRLDKRAAVPLAPKIVIADPPDFSHQMHHVLANAPVVLYPTLNRHHWDWAPNTEDFRAYLSAWFDGIEFERWSPQVEFVATVGERTADLINLRIVYHDATNGDQEGIVKLEFFPHVPPNNGPWRYDEMNIAYRDYLNKTGRPGQWALNMDDLDDFYNRIRPKDAFLLVLQTREALFWRDKRGDVSCPHALTRHKWRIANVSLSSLAPPYNSRQARIPAMDLWPIQVVVGIKDPRVSAKKNGIPQTSSAFFGLTPDTSPLVAAAAEADKYFTGVSRTARSGLADRLGFNAPFTVKNLMADVDNENLDYGLAIDTNARGQMTALWLASVCMSTTHELSHGIGIKHCPNSCVMHVGGRKSYVHEVGIPVYPEPCALCLEKLMYAITERQIERDHDMNANSTKLTLPPELHRSRAIVERYGRLFWLLGTDHFKKNFTFAAVRKYIRGILSRYDPNFVLDSKFDTLVIIC